MAVKKTKKEIYLLDKAKTLPSDPGCYLMKDLKENILYVGKAKNLKNRVKSYFDSSAKTVKTSFMVGHVRDFDFIVTQSDAEALVLENNLIKKHSPKYNIRMKDDKSYPYIIIDTDEPFARLKYVRKPKRKKGRLFFGPFPHGTSISLLARVLTKSFKLRDCSLSEFNRRKRPCLLYQMDQCSAPCVSYISEDLYEQDLKNTIDILKAKKGAKKVIKQMQEHMFEYSDNEEFEKASLLRDNIEVLNSFVENSQKQSAEIVKDEKDVDIVAYYVGEQEVDISLYSIREGLLIGHKSFSFIHSEIDDIESEVISFLMQYYTETQEILPKFLYSIFSNENNKTFELALNKSLEDLNTNVKIKIPKSGRYKDLFDSTAKHAQESQRVRLENQDSMYVALSRLQSLLNMRERPRIIECYDVAIWQGKSPTASQIVFDEGKPDKKNYRHYNLKELPEGNNDFAMMKEVISRRLKKGNLPDVFLIDGGKAQVSTVCAVLKELDIEVPVVGIAKAKTLGEKNYTKDNLKTQERLVIPGRANPFILGKSPSLLRLCVAMRDEAHRFSRILHHKKEEGRIFHSWLDEVDGIGIKTKEKLLKHRLFSQERMMNLTQEQISSLFDVNISTAQKIKQYLSRLV